MLLKKYEAHSSCTLQPTQLNSIMEVEVRKQQLKQFQDDSDSESESE